MKAILVLPLLLAAAGCTRVVDIDVDQGPVRLVVEGRIELRTGNSTGHQEIRLTTTDVFDRAGPPPAARGAVVVVTDGAGGTFPFAEVAARPGVYAADGIHPVVGRRYTLTIDFQGDRYQATHELLPVAPIDSLYFEFEEEGLAQGDSGFRAVIDYTDPAGRDDYYLWELRVDGVPRIAVDPGNRFRIISEDRFYDGGRVVGYQPYDEEVVDPGQRVSVRQVALSETAFRYYFAIFEQTTGGGGPFSAPPASVRGNVANLTDPARVALGFFLAAQVAEREAVVPTR